MKGHKLKDDVLNSNGYDTPTLESRPGIFDLCRRNVLRNKHVLNINPHIVKPYPYHAQNPQMFDF